MWLRLRLRIWIYRVKIDFVGAYRKCILITTIDSSIHVLFFMKLSLDQHHLDVQNMQKRRYFDLDNIGHVFVDRIQVCDGQQHYLNLLQLCNSILKCFNDVKTWNATSSYWTRLCHFCPQLYLSLTTAGPDYVTFVPSSICS